MKGLPDYSKYKYTVKEKLKYITLYTVGALVLSWLFFRSLKLWLISFVFLPIYLIYNKKGLISKRKKLLSHQFMDFLNCISSSLISGNNLEKAILDSKGDLYRQYNCNDGYGNMMIYEAEILQRRISTNESVEVGLSDFAQRSGNEDILSFSQAVKICRLTGGSINEIIKSTCSIIGRKERIENEIDLICMENKLNFRILMAIPIVLSAIMSTVSFDYIAVLYTDRGRFVAAIVLACLAAAWGIGIKLLKFSY